MKTILLSLFILSSFSSYAYEYGEDETTMYRCSSVGEQVNRHTGRVHQVIFMGQVYDTQEAAEGSALAVCEAARTRFCSLHKCDSWEIN